MTFEKVSLLLILFLFIAKVGDAETRIVLAEKASASELSAALELQADILKVYPRENVSLEISPVDRNTDFKGNTISVGTSQSLGGKQVAEALEPETFLLQTSPGSVAEATNCLILGADDSGVAYGVYEFSKRVLGIDPMEYWTGREPNEKDEFVIPELSYRERPPVFKIRGFSTIEFELLANWKGRKLTVELDVWKEVIDSLVRLRFNAIDCYGLMGRPEYYLSDSYQGETVYHSDLELLGQFIDYAHSKGMLVQVPMHLSWEFNHLEEDEVCITTNFDRWMEIYSHYLSESPLGKGDLFLASPRHPLFDEPYFCEEENSIDVPSGPLLEVIFSGLGKLINKYSPGSTLVGELAHEGRDLWANREFTPRHEVQLLWADNGQGEIDSWPAKDRAFLFGVSLHAGRSSGQVVQNPYPERIQETLMEATDRGLTESCWISGPNFKSFVFNLEAGANCMWSPHAFEVEEYYKEWATRYFGKEAGDSVIKSLKLLADANKYGGEYQELISRCLEILDDLREGENEAIEIGPVRTALALAQRSFELAAEIEATVPEESKNVFDDQILFPAKTYLEILEFLKLLIELNNHSPTGVFVDSSVKSLDFMGKDLREHLSNLRANLEKGSRWKKWRNWTNPENFPIDSSIPELEDLDSVLSAL